MSVLPSSDTTKLPAATEAGQVYDHASVQSPVPSTAKWRVLPVPVPLNEAVTLAFVLPWLGLCDRLCFGLAEMEGAPEELAAPGLVDWCCAAVCLGVGPLQATTTPTMTRARTAATATPAILVREVRCAGECVCRGWE